MTITSEEYDAWLIHPCTAFFMKAFKTTADLCEQEWKEGSWNSGNADPTALLRLKAKHEAYTAVYTADFDDLEARQET